MAWLSNFLRNVLSIKGLSVDSSKIKTVLNWQRLKTIKEVYKFLGLVRYYKRFIKGFTKLARPFTTLTKKKTHFQWLDSYKKSFKELKKRLTSTLTLTLPEDGVEYDLCTDTSYGGFGVVLMQ